MFGWRIQMEQERPGRHEFHVEISGIDNFAKFCALIRGVPVDDAEVAEIANKVRAEREALAANAAKNTPVP